jgi:argininosuccinate synthase
VANKPTAGNSFLTSSEMADRKKVVLGFSGGLDTSFCALYLSQEMDYEVHSVLVDTGGFSQQELTDIENRALSLGVSSHKSISAVQSYYERIIRFLVFGNVLKNNTYPLSVSAERMSQALAIADYAATCGADAVAHGSTGAGNDQVRFDMIFHIRIPGIAILTPIRDLKLTREQEISYLKDKGVKMNFEKAAYSVNKGIWGNSVGGKETLHSREFLPDEAFPTPLTRTGLEELSLGFERGELRLVNGKKFEHPVDAIFALRDIASPFGIGRDIHVGDTIIGIKGRVGFEAAAALIIIKAHHSLEKHVLTKWQLSWKDQISMFYGNWLHEGQILDPVMRDIEAFLESSQQQVTGEVFLTLFPYRFRINGIQSPNDLMNERFGKYGEMNTGWTAEDVRGFSKIFGQQTTIWHRIKEQNPPQS